MKHPKETCYRHYIFIFYTSSVTERASEIVLYFADLTGV